MDPQYQQQQPPQYGQPQPQYQQAGASGASHGMSSLISSIGSDIMAGISYLLGIFWVVGLVLQIVVFAIEKNRFVKFHAAQAMLLGVAEVVIGFLYIIINGVLAVGAAADQSGVVGVGGGFVSLLLGCVAGILGLVIFAFWIWGMIAAFTGKPTKLPIVGSFAERLAGGTEGTV